MSKGSKDRVAKRPEFKKGHRKAYGDRKKVDGRRTKRVIRDGKIVDPDEQLKTIPVVDYSEYDKLHRLAQGRILELYGVTPEQMRMRP